MMKQQVINYEFDILQHHLIHSTTPILPKPQNPHRYSQWMLLNTLSMIGDWENKELKWIGNSEGSFVIAYFYAMFRVCAGKQDVLIRLKYSLYKVCQYCLNLAEQKNIVQFIGLLEQDKPLLGAYLKKNSHLEDLLIKIYDGSISSVKLENETQTDPLLKLQYYSEVLFDFLKVEDMGKGASGILIRLDGDEEKMYIIREKDCYFIIQNRFKCYQDPNQLEIGNFSDCSIINQAMDEEETIKDHDKRLKIPSSRNRNRNKLKSPNRGSPEPHGENHSIEAKIYQRKIPQFLAHHHQKTTQIRGSLQQVQQPLIPRNKPPHKVIHHPIKQNYSKKLLVNYDNKNFASIPSNDSKTIIKKTVTKKSRDYSIGAQSPQTSKAHHLKKPNPEPYVTNSSANYEKYASDSILRGRIVENSPDQTINNDSSLKIKHRKDESQRLVCEAFHPEIKSRSHKNHRSGTSESPALKHFQYHH